MAEGAVDALAPTAPARPNTIWRRALSGAAGRGYTLTFKQLPSVIEPGFWSVTMYDARTDYPVRNPIDRYYAPAEQMVRSLRDPGSYELPLIKAANTWWVPDVPRRCLLPPWREGRGGTCSGT